MLISCRRRVRWCGSGEATFRPASGKEGSNIGRRRVGASRIIHRVRRMCQCPHGRPVVGRFQVRSRSPQQDLLPRLPEKTSRSPSYTRLVVLGRRHRNNRGGVPVVASPGSSKWKGKLLLRWVSIFHLWIFAGVLCRPAASSNSVLVFPELKRTAPLAVRSGPLAATVLSQTIGALFLLWGSAQQVDCAQEAIRPTESAVSAGETVLVEEEEVPAPVSGQQREGSLGVRPSYPQRDEGSPPLPASSSSNPDEGDPTEKWSSGTSLERNKNNPTEPPPRSSSSSPAVGGAPREEPPAPTRPLPTAYSDGTRRPPAPPTSGENSTHHASSDRQPGRLTERTAAATPNPEEEKSYSFPPHHGSCPTASSPPPKNQDPPTGPRALPGRSSQNGRRGSFVSRRPKSRIPKVLMQMSSSEEGYHHVRRVKERMGRDWHYVHWTDRTCLKFIAKTPIPGLFEEARKEVRTMFLIWELCSGYG